MEAITKVNLVIIKYKDKDNTTGKGPKDTKAHGSIIRCMERETYIGRMETDTKATFLIIRCMGKDFSMIKLELLFLEHGKKVVKTAYLHRQHQKERSKKGYGPSIS